MENDLKNLISQATNKANENQYKKKSNLFKPKIARFKLVVHFLDGNNKTFYGFATFRSSKNGVKTIIINEELGFHKLILLVRDYLKGAYKDVNGVKQYTNQQNFITAIIYCKLGENMSTDVMDYNFILCKWVRNREPEIIKPAFQDGKLILEPLKQIQLLRENTSNRSI